MYRDTRWVGALPEHGLVLTTESGAPLHGSTVTHAFRDCLAAACIEWCGFHFLRHQNASVLRALRVSPRDLQDHLGHADFSTTMNTYAHRVPDPTIHLAALVDEARATGRATR